MKMQVLGYTMACVNIVEILQVGRVSLILAIKQVPVLRNCVDISGQLCGSVSSNSLLQRLMAINLE